MLTVQAVNLTGLTDDQPCDYDVTVQVNWQTLWSGVVVGHWRRDGWAALLHRIADTAQRLGH